MPWTRYAKPRGRRESDVERPGAKFQIGKYVDDSGDAVMAVVEMGMKTLDPIQRLDGHATKHERNRIGGYISNLHDIHAWNRIHTTQHVQFSNDWRFMPTP